MADYLTRVAEAVRSACFEACNENGGDMGAICTVDLSAVIASVPRPEMAAKYFAYDQEVGFDLYDTANEAKKAAQESVDEYRSEAAEGWDEAVENVCWGVVLGKTHEIEFDDGYDGSAGLADCGRPVDYVLVSEPVAAQPAVPEAPQTDQPAAPGAIIKRFGYQPLFNAISAATEWMDGRMIGISVFAFEASLLAAAPEAPQVADDAATLRSAIRAMAAMLQAREWAEHVSNDPDVTDLEVQITELVGTATKLREQNATLVAALMPFAFICKEGVVTKNYVTVTTCAEYFNRAEKVLAALAIAEGGAA